MIHHVAASEYVCVNCTVKCCFVWCHNTLQLNDPVSLSIRSIKALHCPSYSLCHISGKELKCTVGLYWILSNYKIVFYFYFMFHVAVGSVISNLNERKLRQKKWYCQSYRFFVTLLTGKPLCPDYLIWLPPKTFTHSAFVSFHDCV